MQSNDMEKLTHKAFFFFFFFKKRKLKEKQRENKVGQNVGSSCSYLFQRKEFTIKTYSEMIKGGGILFQETQLCGCLEQCMVLASFTTLQPNTVLCAVLPNLILV